MSEIPTSLSTGLGRTNLFIKQRCGNCKHLKRIPHSAYEKLCITLGMTDISAPCERFSADPSKIRFKTSRNARRALEFLQELSDDKLALYASLILEERRTRSNGYSFGQTVYISINGQDYLSNYRRLKVVASDSKYIHLVADDGFTAMVLHGSVLSSEEWATKKAWLIKKERINDPRMAKYYASASHAELQKRKVSESLNVLEFDSTSRHDFALTSGSVRKRRTERCTPLDLIIAKDATIRTR